MAADAAANLFEEWDENFLDEVIHVSELATSSAAPEPCPQPPPEPLHGGGGGEGGTSYSPPRELSQRVPDSDDVIKGFDVPFPAFDRKSSRGPSISERSKRDASRAVKQLNHREQGGQHVRKADKKKEPPKSTFPQIELKDADVQRRYCKYVEHQTDTDDDLHLSSRFQNGDSENDQAVSRITVVIPTCKSIGVQTDKSESSTPLSIKNDIYTTQRQRSKLLAVWDLAGGQGSQRNIVSELLVACETDLGILFGGLNFVSRATASCLVDQKPPARSAEAEKVFNLYSMLTKIGCEMVKLEALLEALVELCRLDNDVIVYRSLRVLHKALIHTDSLDVRSNKRDNVLVEGPSSRNNTAETSGFRLDEFSDSIFTVFRTGLSSAENIHKNETVTHTYALSTSCLDWVSVFELMSQIAARNPEECIRLEAISIMNMILIRSNAYMDRERFGRVLGFETISKFLQKDSGVGVQKEAVHLLHLLLNCSQFMATFCSGCKEEVESVGDVNRDAKSGPAVHEFGSILEGLAGCVACGGNSTLELKLRRDTVTLLAFLASSGKLGFEILLVQRLLKRSNYLALMLQMLVAEMDSEVSNISLPSDVFKERTLLIRETLIFLNRLVSNPQFSAPVLRVLTDSRGTACLAVDVANRLSCKSKWCWQSDSMTRQMRETEIVELARVFKKRIFTYIENGSP